MSLRAARWRFKRVLHHLADDAREKSNDGGENAEKWSYIGHDARHQFPNLRINEPIQNERLELDKSDGDKENKRPPENSDLRFSDLFETLRSDRKRPQSNIEKDS